MKLTFIENKLTWILLSVFLFTIYFLPYFVKGENCYIEQFDNLDQISYIGIFDGKFQGSFFPNESMEEFYMPDIEPIFRVSLVTVPKIFWQFGFLPGYIINEIIYRILAFMGFFLLLRNYILKKIPIIFSALLSISFIYLPFWSQGGLSVAGIPLLIYAFTNLYFSKKIFISYLIVIVYPFYSGFFLSGVFILFCLLIIIIHFIKKRQAVKHLIISLITLTILYVLINYPFFLINFIYKIPTNRVGIKLAGKGFETVLINFINFFFTSHLHSKSNHQYIILPTVLLFLIIKNKNYELSKYFKIICSFIIFTAIIYSLYNYKPINDFYTKLGFGFNYSRFYLLNVGLWYLLWAICLLNLYKRIKNKKIAQTFILILIISQIGINYFHSSWRIWNSKPTFKEVVSKELFFEINEHLIKTERNYNKNKIRIGCIGFHPSIANFNGYKTIGGYIPVYPLKFKKDFYKIIKDEIKQNEKLYQYFLKWGQQIYLFDDKISMRLNNQYIIKKYFKTIKCDLNIEELKKYDVKYIFSTARILNSNEIGLKNIYINNEPEYYYSFYVYLIGD
jgi:hypothetical protein